MKKNELIKLLNSVPENMEIVLASDDEGNSYHKVSIAYGIEDIKTKNGTTKAFILYPDWEQVEFLY